MAQRPNADMVTILRAIRRKAKLGQAGTVVKKLSSRPAWVRKLPPNEAEAAMLVIESVRRFAIATARKK